MLGIAAIVASAGLIHAAAPRPAPSFCPHLKEFPLEIGSLRNETIALRLIVNDTHGHTAVNRSFLVWPMSRGELFWLRLDDGFYSAVVVIGHAAVLAFEFEVGPCALGLVIGLCNRARTTVSILVA